MTYVDKNQLVEKFDNNMDIEYTLKEPQLYKIHQSEISMYYKSISLYRCSFQSRNFEIQSPDVFTSDIMRFLDRTEPSLPEI